MDTAAAVLDPIQKLSADLKKAGAMLSKDEARFLVDYYYIAQEDRKRGYNQEKALKKNDEPHGVITWLAGNAERIENDIKAVLGGWAANHKAGRWAQSIWGIGPVLSAGLLAHIDIDQAPSVGHIWRFAGLDPTSEWKKGEKRPFNAGLKVLCYKLGECFVKVSNKKEDIYGHVYAKRKLLEIERNEKGLFADQAKAKLAKFAIDKKTDAYAWYAGCLTAEQAKQLRESEAAAGAAHKMAGPVGSGIQMLPPAHIHSRARRYAVKLFLSAFHTVLYFDKHNRLPPKPYIFTDQAKKLGLGDHSTYFGVPNAELVPGLQEAQNAQGPWSLPGLLHEKNAQEEPDSDEGDPA